MWILKNSKQLLDNLQSNSNTSVNSIKTFDFSTTIPLAYFTSPPRLNSEEPWLYVATIPHDQLKSRLASIVNQAFCFKNGKKRYEYIVKYNSTYFVKSHSDAKHKYTEDDIVRMINFLLIIYLKSVVVRFFQHVIGIPMGTNCAPLLADIFLFSYEAEFIQTLIKRGKRHLAKSFNFTYIYIDVFSLNDHKFSDYVYDIYPAELEIKETTDDQYRSSFLELLLEIDKDGRLRVKIYDKRDDFNFDIVNFPFLCGNVTSITIYGVYISQLIRYVRATTFYDDFLSRSCRLTSKLMRQGYERFKLISAFKEFYGRHKILVDRYKVSVTHIISDLF